jgi:PGF-pre-PGF domain-containing protein
VSPSEPVTVSFQGNDRESVTAKQARINVSSETRDLQVDVSQIASLPDDVTQSPDNTIQRFNISTTAKESDIESASFQFEVSKSVLPESADPVFYRYQGGEWTALNTSVIEETQSTMTVEMETPGFSYFAIGTETPGQVATSTEVTSQDTTEVPQDSDQTAVSDNDQTGISDSTDPGSSDAGGTPGGNQKQTSGDQSDPNSQSNDLTATDQPGFTLLTIISALIIFAGWRIRRL